MQDQDRADQGGDEFTSSEGLALTLSYMHDPASVPCPSCGPGTIEVVAYLDPGGMEDGMVRSASPDGEYTVVLYCHDCGRAGALNLSPDDRRGLPDDAPDDESSGEEGRRAA